MPNIAASPQSCMCKATMANYKTLCKSHCDDDVGCMGYDFFVDETWVECYFYTDSKSPCPNDCEKLSEGNKGLLVNDPVEDTSYSGCYIKSGNVHKCRIYIMFY